MILTNRRILVFWKVSVVLFEQLHVAYIFFCLVGT